MNGFGDDEVAADERVDGHEWLFVEHGVVLRLPVRPVAIKHQQGGARASANRDSDVRHHILEWPLELAQESAPAIFDVTAVLHLP